MVGWKDVLVPRPYPREFRDDVVRVARNRDDGVTIEQIAADFGVHPMTLSKWMRQADVDEGTKPEPAPPTLLSCAKRDAGSRCSSRRTRCCAAGRPICRSPICRKKALPARERVRRRRDPRRGDVPGTQARPPALPSLAGPPSDQRRSHRGLRANALFDAHRDDLEFGYRYL